MYMCEITQSTHTPLHRTCREQPPTATPLEAHTRTDCREHFTEMDRIRMTGWQICSRTSCRGLTIRRIDSTTRTRYITSLLSGKGCNRRRTRLGRHTKTLKNVRSVRERTKTHENVRERARTFENARERTRRHEYVREASESARASERAREKEGQKEIDLLVEVAVKPACCCCLRALCIHCVEAHERI